LASYSIIPLRIGVSGQRVVEEGEVGAVDAGKGGGGAKETRGKWTTNFWYCLTGINSWLLLVLNNIDALK
jgi:hypothetical protein